MFHPAVCVWTCLTIEKQYFQKQLFWQHRTESLLSLVPLRRSELLLQSDMKTKQNFVPLTSLSLLVPIQIEWPMLWRITKNYLHNEGTCKWVNRAPIFFWYELLPTTSGPQKFKKIGVVKVDYFDFPGEIFGKQVWIRC